MFKQVLMEDEHVVRAYQLFRDGIAFTERRLILKDVQGFAGAKIEWHSVPYRSISHFAIETAGVNDWDAKLKIYVSGNQTPAITKKRSTESSASSKWATSWPVTSTHRRVARMTPPPAPPQLAGVGATEWTRVVGLLIERGHWDPLRSTVLLAYCESYADWHRMREQVRGRGAGTTDQGAGRRSSSRGGHGCAIPTRPQRPTPPSASTWISASRSILKVHQKFTISDRLVKRWSGVHAWVVRARAWDDHQDRIQVAVSTDAIQTMRLEHATWGRSVSAAAVETIDTRMQAWRDRGRVGEPPFSVVDAASVPPRRHPPQVDGARDGTRAGGSCPAKPSRSGPHDWRPS